MTDFTIFTQTPNAFGDIQFGIRNAKGFCVRSEKTFEDAENAIARKVETGSFDVAITELQAQAYLKAFAARVESDARMGFTRD